MIRQILVIVTCLVAVAIALLVFGVSTRKESATQVSPILLSTPEPIAPALITDSAPPSVPAPGTVVRPLTEGAAPERPPMIALDAGPLLWEQQLAAASARGKDATGNAREILALLPTLPEEALATAAEQAIERLPDSSYSAIALPVVTNPKTHGQVMSVLFADLMERPDAVTLPALLSIARNAAHPYSSAALDNLQLLLKTDHQTNWPQWERAIQRALDGQVR
jgi:hypothetical protein